MNLENEDNEHEPHDLSPQQAAWIDPLRASLEAHPARVPTCPGCALFGLCALHDTTPNPEPTE